MVQFYTVLLIFSLRLHYFGLHCLSKTQYTVSSGVLLYFTLYCIWFIDIYENLSTWSVIEIIFSQFYFTPFLKLTLLLFHLLLAFIIKLEVFLATLNRKRILLFWTLKWIYLSLVTSTNSFLHFISLQIVRTAFVCCYNIS